MDTADLDHIDELWDKYFETKDPGIKNQIISHYLFLVRLVVRRLMPQYKNYSEEDDLVSCGVLGLIDAVNKFDRSYGVKFQTYASVRIRGEIIDFMRKQDWAPTSLRKKISGIEDAYEALEAKWNRRPTEQEIADYLGLKQSVVQKVLQKAHMFNLISFEAMLLEKEPEESSPVAGGDLYQQIENKFMSKTLQTLVETLPEREKMVITLHYYEGFTMKSIAQILDISESRVSQIHSKILMEMRLKLSG